MTGDEPMDGPDVLLPGADEFRGNTEDEFRGNTEDEFRGNTEDEFRGSTESDVSRLLAHVGTQPMPDEVFATISRALSIEVELRREGIDDPTAAGLKDFDAFDDTALASDVTNAADADLEGLCLDSECPDGDASAS